MVTPCPSMEAQPTPPSRQTLGRIVVFGAGGVGGYFGGLLANEGHEVTFIARGEHLAAIQAGGLQVRSVHGDFHLADAQATDSPREAGSAGTVIVAVKGYQLAASLEGLKALTGSDTTVVPLLNGVEAPRILGDALGRERVVGGLCRVVAMIEAPGVIRQVSQIRQIVLGEMNQERSQRVQQLVDAWADTGAETVHAANIEAAMWDKLVFIASFGGVTSLTQANAGELRASPEAYALFAEAMREVEAVARAAGIELTEDTVSRALDIVASLEPEATSSMQRDVAAGRPFELESFSGAVLRQARRVGVETPVHAAIYGLLKPRLMRTLEP